MKITVELDGSDGQHLIALAAMITSLGGPPSALVSDGYPTPPAVGTVGKLAEIFEDGLAAAATIVPPPPPAAVTSPQAVPNAPVPPAPPETAVAVPPPPVTSGAADASGDRDVAGTPWDERIHAGSRAKNADNTWRRRRNLDDATYEQVMTELRGTAPAVSVPVPPAPPAPVATESTAVAAIPATDVPPPPKAPAGSVTDAEGFTYAATLQYATNLKHTYDTMNAVVADMGIGATQAKELLKMPEHWPMFRMLLDANAPGAA